MARRRCKVVYKITFPNGKIYVGQDVTDTPAYMGSFNRDLVAADFDEDTRRDFSLRKEILWESENATQDEVNQKERHFILALRSNNPSIGYNRRPRWVSCGAANE